MVKVGEIEDIREALIDDAFPIGDSRLIPKESKSGYRGVTCCNDCNRKKKYLAKIKINGKTKFLGRYYTIEEAARVYDKAAKILYGKAAILNFPEKC